MKITLQWIKRTVFAIGASLVTSVLGQAQPGLARAYFYTEVGFRGECLVVEAGASVDNLEFTRDPRGRPFNDRIRSVRLEGPVRAAVFHHAQFRGESTWLNRDASNLASHPFSESSRDSWDRAISSIRVEALGPGARPSTAWQRRDVERVIRANYRDFFGHEPDPAGLRFYTSRLLDAGWGEDQLQDALRRSDEFRNRDLDAIVRRVYRDVLKRDPDPAGLAAYQRGLGRGMTEGEMRTELARSREGRQVEARAIVTRAYRELLKREPDPEGLETNTRTMVEKGWSESQLREVFRRSEEFRKLPR